MTNQGPRKAVELTMTEVIAGILERGEEPEAAAHRECRWRFRQIVVP